MTNPGDVVLVYMDNSPAFFARVEQITPDIKPEWFHIKLLVLQMPLLVVTWILRAAYCNGEEFTMGGHPMRIETVVAPTEEQMAEESEQTERKKLERKEPPKPALVEPKKGQKVISMADRRKKEPEPS
ncbi:MAG: hypothetical protein WAW37_20895 [Syntrophobacteraceae bacterium]